jgi:hypothetical protein
MTNFWGNSSSQYIAKKIIRPDFFATPGERVLLWMTFVYLVFWSCFGKASISCTKAYQNVTWIAAILEAKRPKLHRTSRTTPHTVTFGETPMYHRDRNWSEATQTLKKLYKLLETLRNFIELPEQLHIL